MKAGIYFLGLIGLLVPGLRADNLTISGGTVDYKYFDSIDGTITASSISIEGHGNVRLTAGSSVKLQTGFHAEAGSLFHATILADPKSSGSYGFSTVNYASTGNQKISPRYTSPTSGYSISRRLDLSDFYSMDSTKSTYWTFDSDSSPINGILKVPTGSGPFPLAVFIHGGHPYYDYSDEGFEYLCELLASKGILAASIDANFINGAGGDVGTRTILLLEHVRQFEIWNATYGHALYQKVDMDKVMLVGHSLGGRAVALASSYNTLSSVSPGVAIDGSGDLGPYGFDLSAIVAIAPAGLVTGPVVEDNFFTIQGSKDNDVIDFQGQISYDLSHAITSNPVTSGSGYKALAWVYGANHNYFNESWSAEAYESGHEPISRSDQEAIAEVYIGAIAEAMLLDQIRYIELLKDHEFGNGWFPDTEIVSQFQPRVRRFINHYEEDDTVSTLSSPNSGSNTYNGISVSEMELNDNDNIAFNVLFQKTDGVEASWASSGGYYLMSFSTAIDATDFDCLSFRVGQVVHTNNTVDTDQDFTIQITDGSSGTASFTVSSVSQILYPDIRAWSSYAREMVMQSVRIPLSLIEADGVDTTDITSIKFVMDQTSSGRIYFDEIQFSN